VIDNLLVSKLQVRADGDIDVSQYVHSKTIEKIVVKIPPEIARIVGAVDMQMEKHLRVLCSQKAYFSMDPAKAPEFALMEAQKAFQAMLAGDHGQADKRMIGLVFGAFAQARLLAQGRKILVIHGLLPFLEFCLQKRNDGKMQQGRASAKKKVQSTLVESQQFGQMFGLAQKAVDAGIVHPKISQLVSLLGSHFQRDADSRVIIFTSLRDSVESIVLSVAKVPNVKVSRFVGQANKGQKQSEQLEVIAKFRSGVFNVLVATCVGEEGLDVGECDLIVNYDTSASPIRTMQRMGRTGRKRQGRCVSILTEGAEENAYDKSKSTGNNILRTLQSNKDSFRFYRGEEEDVRGLVPGKIAKPEIRNVRAPDVPMKEARRLRKNNGKPEKRSKGSPDNADQLVSYLREHEIEESDFDLMWPKQELFDELLSESFLDFFDGSRGGVDVAPSVRRTAMHDLAMFMEHDVGAMNEYNGVSVSVAKRAQGRRDEQQPARAKKARVPATTIYDMDSSDDSSDARPKAGSDRWSQFIGNDDDVEQRPKRQEQQDDDGEMYIPSDVWFEKEKEGMDDEEMYAPSEIWFNKEEAAPGVDKGTEKPSQASRGPSLPPVEIDLVESPPRKKAAVVAGAASGPIGSASPNAHVFKSPANRLSFGRKLGGTSATGSAPFALDMDVIPLRMRNILLALPSAPKRGLYFPPAPSLVQDNSGISRVIDCPVCSIAFSENLKLALHCFQKHWATKGEAGRPAMLFHPSSSVAAASSSSSSSVSPSLSLSSKPAQATPSSLSRPTTSKFGGDSQSAASPQSQFEVETISAQREDSSGKICYFVRWKGFPTQNCTWEPAEHLINCTEALREFHAREKVRKNATIGAAAAAPSPATLEKPKYNVCVLACLLFLTSC
jgi:superfamily II DNA/RNA helicase